MLRSLILPNGFCFRTRVIQEEGLYVYSMHNIEEKVKVKNTLFSFGMVTDSYERQDII
jgi:hypothetical protein